MYVFIINFNPVKCIAKYKYCEGTETYIEQYAKIFCKGICKMTFFPIFFPFEPNVSFFNKQARNPGRKGLQILVDGLTGLTRLTGLTGLT